jgi:hypothetical protein
VKVRLAFNIGRPDAHRLGIVDPSDGAIISVDDRAGAEMVRKGWAVEYSGKPKADTPDDAPEIKAIPPAELEAVPPVEVETERDWPGDGPEGDEPDDESSDDESSDPLPTTDDLASPPRRRRGRPRKDSGR